MDGWMGHSNSFTALSFFEVWLQNEAIPLCYLAYIPMLNRARYVNETSAVIDEKV
jgi:hypothetical protein